MAAIAFMAVSCQNGGGNLSSSSTPTDSLMFYLGKIEGSNYLREANRDTTLKESSSKQAYVNGLRAGLAALKDGDENYNRGVMMGMQMAAQIMNYSEQNDVKINPNVYVGSVASTIMADTMPNVNEAQSNVRQLMQNIEKAKQEKDKAASQESLKKVAQGAGLPAITDDLYGKATSTTDGEALKDGDEVELSGQFTKEDGEPISIGLNPKWKIGERRNFPEVVNEALKSLKSGESGEFMTTAHAIYGARAKQMNLEPNDVIKFTLTATLVPAPEEEKAESAK